MKQHLRTVVIIFLLAVLTLLIMDFNSRMETLRRLSSERDQVAQQVTQLAQTQQVLETQIAYANSDEAVRAWAYEQGGMAAPGDVLVQPLPPFDSTPQPVVRAPLPPQQYENWEYWWALFFDNP
ncbi:MAG: hypothetical protein OHK0052_25030 [Anaerolineales bacterium]